MPNHHAVPDLETVQALDARIDVDRPRVALRPSQGHEPRDVFMAILGRINRLHDHPEWYNALTHNCTTALRGDARPYAGRSWTSWKLLLNAHVDELAYEIGAVDRSVPLPELRARSRINDR